jgi:hypothetical protein
VKGGEIQDKTAALINIPMIQVIRQAGGSYFPAGKQIRAFALTNNLFLARPYSTIFTEREENMKRIVILGSGAGGTMTAAGLRKHLNAGECPPLPAGLAFYPVWCLHRTGLSKTQTGIYSQGR